MTIVYYSETRRLRGDNKQKCHKQDPAGANGKVYTIARVAGHYVPDVYSNWTRWAVQHIDKARAAFPNCKHLPFGLPHNFNRAKYIRGTTGLSGSSPKMDCFTERQLQEKPHRKLATYGEILAVICYGISEDRFNSGKIRKRKRGDKEEEDVAEAEEILKTTTTCRVSMSQKKFVEPMSPNEHMLRSLCFMYFKRSLKDRLLPTTLTHSETEKLFESYSKEVNYPTRWILQGPSAGTDENDTGAAGGDMLFTERYFIEGKQAIPGHAPPYIYPALNDMFDVYGATPPPKWSLIDKMSSPYYVTKKTLGRRAKKDNVILVWVKHRYTVVTFDFETTTDGPKHEPFTCAIAYYVGLLGVPFDFRIFEHEIDEKLPEDYGAVLQRRHFFGRDCAQKMMDFMVSHFLGLKVLMIAHNLRYDLNQLIGNTKGVIVAGIFKTARNTNCAEVDYFHSNPSLYPYPRRIYHMDSFPIVAMSLANLGKSTGVPVQKEIFPYGFYNSDLIKCIEIYTRTNIARNQKNEPCCFNSPYTYTRRVIEALPYLPNGSSDEKEFREAIARAGAIGMNLKSGGEEKEDPDLFFPVVYANYYCELDCEVLLMAFLKHRRETARICYLEEKNGSDPEFVRSKIDCLFAVSASQIASQLLKMSNGLDGTYELSGSARDYIASSVVGGRVMVRANIPHACFKRVDDFDACSLYPTAMARICEELNGLPLGVPKVWTSGMNLENDPSIVYYVISVKITSVTTHLHFPILSYIDEHGGRHFSNFLEGKIITVDKVTWEDAKRHQGVYGEIICGVYFNQGGNRILGKLIRYLYNERKRLKELKNDAGQQVVKLMMNSMYGRTIMKPVKTDTSFISERTKIQDFIQKHSVSIQTISFVRPDFAVVERQKSLYKHYSQPQIGSFILSMSKRIMNEVMVLAEKICAPIHYQDTDSMHIEHDMIPILGEAFFKTYQRPLIALDYSDSSSSSLKPYEHPCEELGLFHGDFEKKRGYEKPYSEKSVYCGKKMYFDLLVYKVADPSSQQLPDLQVAHVRMKGIPTDALRSYVKEEGSRERGDVVNELHGLYMSLLNGERHKINLLACKKPFFVFDRAMNTSTRKTFYREIGLLEYQKKRAIEEAVKSGFFSLIPDGTDISHIVATSQRRYSSSTPLFPEEEHQFEASATRGRVTDLTQIMETNISDPTEANIEEAYIQVRKRKKDRRRTARGWFLDLEADESDEDDCEQEDDESDEDDDHEKNQKEEEEIEYEEGEEGVEISHAAILEDMRKKDEEEREMDSFWSNFIVPDHNSEDDDDFVCDNLDDLVFPEGILEDLLNEEDHE